MEDLSLHILDIVENAIAAMAERVEVRIVEDTTNDLLSVEIKDDGKGMDAETRRKALDPFFTTRTTRRVGLGIPLLAQAARESEGELELVSAVGKGTLVRASFRRSHPDRKPLGDIPATLETLMIGNPGVDFLYEHRKGDRTMRIDTREVVKQ